MDNEDSWERSLEEPEIVWFGGSVPPSSPSPGAEAEADLMLVAADTNEGRSLGNDQIQLGGSTGVIQRRTSLASASIPSAPPLLPQPSGRYDRSVTAAEAETPAPAPPMAAPLPTPATHAYLGEATTGSTLSRKDLEIGSIVELPILSLAGVVLFPGESLPLRLRNPAYTALAQSMLDEDDVRHRDRGDDRSQPRRHTARHLGVVNRLTSRSGGLLVRTSPVGTTAEIRSGHENFVSDGSGVAVMARGRHRFRLIEDLGWRRGVRYWKVIISPDLCPGPLRAPLPQAFRNSRSSRCWAMAAPSFVVNAHSPTDLAARAACLLREQREPHSPVRRLPSNGEGRAGESSATSGGASGAAIGANHATDSAPTTTLRTAQRGRSPGIRRSRSSMSRSYAAPRHTDSKSNGYDGEGRGLEDVKNHFLLGGRGKLDPTLFSFWLAANLPLDDDARQELLMHDSVVMRLRLEVKHLEQSRRRALCCAGCMTTVAWEGDVFTLPGAEGVVGTYVNAMGYVHQTVTVRNARNLLLEGRPEIEHSWFPGYAWTTAYCAECPQSLGWRFTAINSPESSSPLRSILSPPVADASPSATHSAFAIGGNDGSVGRAAVPNRDQVGPASFFGLRRTLLIRDQ